MPQVLDFFFFTGSTYTYLTVNRIEALAAQAGVTVRWRPYNLRALAVPGIKFFPDGAPKTRYMWRDLERRAKRYGMPFTAPPPYPVDPDLKALRIATVAAVDGWCAPLMKAQYAAWFLHGKAPGVDQNTEETLASLGHKPAEVLERALSDETTAMLEREVADARGFGIWGSPHFVVGQEMFWGDDRLEDALDWAR